MTFIFIGPNMRLLWQFIKLGALNGLLHIKVKKKEHADNGTVSSGCAYVPNLAVTAMEKTVSEQLILYYESNKGKDYRK
jgi:hypothetical protein